MFNYFKKRAEQNALKAAAKSSAKRAVTVHNFSTAKTIGIITCFKFEIDNAALTKLRKTIKDNKIDLKLLVFYPQDRLPDNVISDPGKLLFSRKECTRFGKPAMDEVQKFIDEKFDILIDLTSEDCFTTRYIATASKASFKVGRMQYDDNPYDFLIVDSKNMSDDEFIEAMESYLSKFK